MKALIRHSVVRHGTVPPRFLFPPPGGYMGAQPRPVSSIPAADMYQGRGSSTMIIPALRIMQTVADHLSTVYFCAHKAAR